MSLGSDSYSLQEMMNTEQQAEIIVSTGIVAGENRNTITKRYTDPASLHYSTDVDVNMLPSLSPPDINEMMHIDFNQGFFRRRCNGVIDGDAVLYAWKNESNEITYDVQNLEIFSTDRTSHLNEVKIGSNYVERWIQEGLERLTDTTYWEELQE